MAPTPTMEPSDGQEEWQRMAREHPVMRMTRNDKGEYSSFNPLALSLDKDDLYVRYKLSVQNFQCFVKLRTTSVPNN